MVLILKHVGLFIVGCVVVSHVYANSFADKVIAVDGITIGGGPESNSEANMHSYRFAVLWDWNQDWIKNSSWLLSGYFDLSFFYWENELNHTDSLSLRGNGSTAGMSFSPVFRIKPRKPFGGWVAPFFEVGIGPSLVTHDEIVAESSSPVDLGTHFQLEDRMGIGLLFGKQQSIELGYRYIHYSNGGVNGDNDGIDFQQLHFTMWF